MTGAIEIDKLYWVDFARARFQVRVLRASEAPGLWDCLSIVTGVELVIPARAFLEEFDGQPRG